MPCYCKKCGAVVVGKFCSCCGTRVRSDLRDFKLELSRRKHAFSNAKYLGGGQSFVRLQAANFAWEQMENRITHGMTVCDDPEVIGQAYSMIPEIEENADRFYHDIMRAYSSI